MTSFESTVPDELGDPAVRAVEVPEPGAVTIVVPTFNEAANIGELLYQITESVPARLPCEVLFVDDSTDDTPEVIREAAQDCPFPVTVLHRAERVGGLGGAVVEGLKAATSDWIVVMDGDLQHPPSLVPELVATGERSSAGLVVASRYIKGGSREGLAGGYRVAVSRGATWLTKTLFPRKLRGISDPMSGFFAIRRSAVTAEILQPLGYKILLELAVRSRPREVTEVPFVFQDRFAGESKSTAQEGFRFLRHLVGLRTASPVARMVVFGLIGATGFVPNLLGLYALTAAGMHYLPHGDRRQPARGRLELPAHRASPLPRATEAPPLGGPRRPVRPDRQRRSGAAHPADRPVRGPLRDGRTLRHRTGPGDDLRPALRRDRSAGLSAAPQQ